MRVEVIDTVDRLAQIELAWDELYKADPYAHIYLSSQFITMAAMKAVGKFRVIAAWSDEGRCVGLLPLVVTIRWSKTERWLYNVLDMLGHVFDADYTGILCDPNLETQVCKAFAAQISKMPSGRIVLNYFDGPASRLNTFTGAFAPDLFETKVNAQFINHGQTNNLICPYIELPETFEQYLGGLSSNARQKLRRLLRQAQSDPSLKITRSRPETYTQDVAILSQLWYQKHVHQKGEKRAAHLADLFKEVILLGLAAGTVYLAILWRAGKPVAAQANYIDLVKRQALFHVGGRDETVRDLSAGLMLQAHCIRWAIANGLLRYDFTIGNEPYKYSLGAQDRQIASAEVFTKTGANVTGRLDDSFRDDVLAIIRKFIREDRRDDAYIAAEQALFVWPDLEPGRDAKVFISNIGIDRS
jgi:CelD/BcsL family acetyltransferase involved in cellulose biosynthesis